MSTSSGRANMEFMFNYNLPPNRLSSPLHATSLPKVRLSFRIPDKHLDERLLLRHVLPLSSLPQTLSGVADEALKTVLDLGLSIPDEHGVKFDDARENAEDDYEEDVAGPYGVSKHFKKNLNDFCHAVASALQIRPPNFHSIFMWGNRERDMQPFDHGLPFVLDGFAATSSKRDNA